jgi:hypothetical protein
VKILCSKRSAAGRVLAGCASVMLLSALHSAPARAVSGPSAVAPYSVSTFAVSESGYSAPDSITFSRNNVFVGYGNGGNPDGSGGAMSTIVKYKMDGTVVTTYPVAGHNDGLRYNPTTGDLWALQNEDANATLIIIDPATGGQKKFELGTGPHGGGYDDIVFEGNDAYISASNPTSGVVDEPGIVRFKSHDKKVKLIGILNDNATATNVVTGEPETLALTDPDSLIVDPFGELVLDSQGDGELIIVQHPGFDCQKNFLVPLTSEAGGATPGNTTADDTVFANAAQGTLLVADKDGEAVYAITAPYFAPGAAYTAIVATSTPGGPTVAACVGQTNLSTGFVTPIVNGLQNPGGMAFIPASHNPKLLPDSVANAAEACP